MSNNLEKLQQEIKDHFPNDKIEFVDIPNKGQAIKVNDQFVKIKFSKEVMKEIESLFKLDLDEEIKRQIVAEINNFLQKSKEE